MKIQINKSKFRVACAAASILALTYSSEAATTSFAFTTDTAFSYTGAAVIGEATDVWAQWTVGNAGPTPIANGISATVSGATDEIYYGGVTFETYSEILQQYIYSSSTLTIVLSGLDSSLFYNVVGIASLDDYFNADIKTFAAVGFNTVSGTLTNNSSATSFSSGVNFATLSSVQPTATGVITLTVATDVGINALQIAAVPEPSVIVMLSFVGLGCLARRKR